jgi:hypothetical protein
MNEHSTPQPPPSSSSLSPDNDDAEILSIIQDALPPFPLYSDSSAVSLSPFTSAGGAGQRDAQQEFDCHPSPQQQSNNNRHLSPNRSSSSGQFYHHSSSPSSFWSRGPPLETIHDSTDNSSTSELPELFTSDPSTISLSISKSTEVQVCILSCRYLYWSFQ